MTKPLKPIYPYFGGKRRAAAQVWEALGEVDRYIEPFFGSGAVLLGSPKPTRSELVNDLDHHVTNLWRALQHDPEGVWQLASCPISEIELKARHKWLKDWKPYDFNDVHTYDVQAAGYWLWVSCVTINPKGNHLQRNGAPKGIKGREFDKEWFDNVVDRFRRVEVLCGDWSRCISNGAINPVLHKSIGVFLDPPYGVGNGVEYEDCTGTVAADVWQWAVANGENPRLRIVVAGYEDGRVLPEGWTAIERVEQGAYSRKSGNRKLERLWLSPHCLKGESEDSPSIFH
jgi:DNA adenine methylase